MTTSEVICACSIIDVKTGAVNKSWVFAVCVHSIRSNSWISLNNILHLFLHSFSFALVSCIKTNLKKTIIEDPVWKTCGF